MSEPSNDIEVIELLVRTLCSDAPDDCEYPRCTCAKQSCIDAGKALSALTAAGYRITKEPTP